jgi:hypothetical protein
MVQDELELMAKNSSAKSGEFSLGKNLNRCTINKICSIELHHNQYPCKFSFMNLGSVLSSNAISSFVDQDPLVLRAVWCFFGKR